jgi:hypothetical protein
MNKSKKITLFLIDGLPKGVREISIDQWNGRAICGPRNKVADILSFPELNSPCVYFLIGYPEEGEFLNVYVGEADPFTQRVKDHLRTKDWWQHVVVFFGSNQNPNKTGIQYLESKCLQELKKAVKCEIKNGNSPTLPSIPKEDVPGLESFYENITLVMPLLGFDIFGLKPISAKNESDQYIFCTGKGVGAKAVLLDDGKVLVLKDSSAIKENVPSFEKHNYKKLKDELLKIGRLQERKGSLYFTDDYIFDSLSAAAAVVLARSAQGPREWVYKNGVSVKDSVEVK